MINVHIRRTAAQENQESLIELIHLLRAAITGRPGYLSSETLKRVDSTGEVLVVSKWQSPFYWNQWYESRERIRIQERIDELLDSPTQYDVYEYV